MKLLNREASPLSGEVWNQIDSEFTTFLSQRLKMRSVVDFTAVAFETDAIPTGELSPIETEGEVSLQARTPLNMMEVRYDFEIPKTVIEELKRDKPNFDDAIFKRVANTFSRVENTIILNGVPETGAAGILSDIPYETIQAKDTKGLIEAVSKMLGTFAGEFVDGPFKLVLSTATLIKMIGESEGGVNIKSRLEALLGADFFVICEAIGDDKILAISQRGEDFSFYNGLDVSIGYTGETEEAYQLFMMESCAFRVVSPEAALIIAF